MWLVRPPFSIFVRFRTDNSHSHFGRSQRFKRRQHTATGTMVAKRWRNTASLTIWRTSGMHAWSTFHSAWWVFLKEIFCCEFSLYNVPFRSPCVASAVFCHCVWIDSNRNLLLKRVSTCVQQASTSKCFIEMLLSSGVYAACSLRVCCFCDTK